MATHKGDVIHYFSWILRKVEVRADEILRQPLAGKYEVPAVNVVTITREEFLRTAPLAQSQTGQAARNSVTPDGMSLEYRTERETEKE